MIQTLMTGRIRTDLRAKWERDIDAGEEAFDAGLRGWDIGLRGVLSAAVAGTEATASTGSGFAS
jgi:hypothetical protein